MKASVEGSTFLFLFLLSTLCFIEKISCHVIDTLANTQVLKDGETIISSGGSFELGFFSPSSKSKNRYLGIWYKNISIQTVVWVANREISLVDAVDFLEVIKPGLVILCDTNCII
ncbi:hypothetical protein ACH5RR_037755 [Cinchona calisaya]|uniref:Bulb-type lectin domain-containing protein n=1 Tax=Cinchona calisaya TaxID=153742 RepID=A0ABD2Y9F2_9GENT